MKVDCCDLRSTAMLGRLLNLGGAGGFLAWTTLIRALTLFYLLCLVSHILCPHKLSTTQPHPSTLRPSHRSGVRRWRWGVSQPRGVAETKTVQPCGCRRQHKTWCWRFSFLRCDNPSPGLLVVHVSCVYTLPCLRLWMSLYHGCHLAYQQWISSVPCSHVMIGSTSGAVQSRERSSQNHT